MGTAHVTTVPRAERLSLRLRELVVGALFALVLLIPKILRIRQNPAWWMAFRVILGIIGAALVILPLSASTNWLAAPTGLCLFLASILLPPAKARFTVDEKARGLSAFVVVNGGTFLSSEGKPADVRLFVAADRLVVLDSSLDALLAIPVPEIVSVSTAPAEDSWTLHIAWSGGAAKFFYQGFFAEHLARVAQTTVQSMVPVQLPVLQKTHAASA